MTDAPDNARDAQGFDAEQHATPNTPQAKGPRPTPPRPGKRQESKRARQADRVRRMLSKRPSGGTGRQRAR